MVVSFARDLEHEIYRQLKGPQGAVIREFLYGTFVLRFHGLPIGWYI